MKQIMYFLLFAILIIPNCTGKSIRERLLNKWCLDYSDLYQFLHKEDVKKVKRMVGHKSITFYDDGHCCIETSKKVNKRWSINKNGFLLLEEEGKPSIKSFVHFNNDGALLLLDIGEHNNERYTICKSH